MDELIGRDRELEAVNGLLADVSEGEFRLLRIEGEPGIGKSRLLDELDLRADRNGWLVLRGSAAEFESELPFGPVIDALDAYLMALDPRAIGRLGPDTAGVLAGVFPSLASFRSETGGPSIVTERFRVHHAIRELLERLSGKAPLALILDDLHWADQASLELVGHLVRRPPQAGILLAFAHRSGQLDATLASSLAIPGLITRIEIGPLDLAQTASLIGLPEARCETVFSQTGGNPFYSKELLRTGASVGSGRAVPDTVAAAISTEVSTLSPDGRSFVEAAAIAGDPFDIDLVDRITCPGGDSSLALDELNRKGLVKPTEIPRRFAFRHPLVRAAIYESIMPGTRLANHEKAASVLAESAAPAGEQARHLVLSARPGDEESALTIATAAAEARAAAPDLAVKWCDAALRIMPEGHPRFRLTVLGSKASAAAAVSRFDDALEALEIAGSLLPEDKVEERVTLASACASLEELLGRHQAAHQRLTGLLEELQSRKSIHAIEVMMSLANDAFLRNEFGEMNDWSGRALAAAREQTDPEYLAVAQATRALCTAFAGPIEEARECADAAAAAFAGFTDDQLDINVDGLVRLVGAELYLERFDDVIEHGQMAIEGSRRTGQSQHFPALYPAVGTAASNSGQFDLAREILDGAIDAARLSKNDHALAWSLFSRASLALREGDLDEAERLSAESIELVATQESGVVKVWSGVIRAATLDAKGRREEALSTLTGAAGGEALEKIPGSWRTGFLALQTEILIALRKEEDAARVCLLAEERATEFDNPLARAHALRARSSLGLATGDTALALGKARESVVLAEAAGAPVDAGFARIAVGASLAGEGLPEEAIAELEAALEGFTRLGAIRGQKLCEQMLRGMGKTIYRRSTAGSGESGVESLTQREREIADLVVDRQTNREIAETLFLSQKTVETHLRNIFAKLGVSSRVEVARTLEKQSAPNRPGQYGPEIRVAP